MDSDIVLSDWLEEFYGHGNWFQTYRFLNLIMRVSETQLLSYLMNISWMVGAHRKHDGWFYHTSKQIDEWLFVNKNRQDKILRRLKSKKVISVIRKGLPSKRWFRIDFQLLHQKVRKARSLLNPKHPGYFSEVAEGHQLDAYHGHQLDAYHGHQQRQNKNTNRNTLLRGTPPSDDVFFDELSSKKVTNSTPFDMYCAKQLRSTITTKRKRYTQWSKSKWVKEFILLRKELDDDTDRIDTALQWYYHHAMDKGVPSINNAAQFRKHFDWLEDVMSKRLEDQPVEVDEESSLQARSLAKLGWPKGSENQLPNAVQKSRTAYIKFSKQVTAYIRKLHKQFTKKDLLNSRNADKVHFAERMDRKLTNVTTAIGNWFGMVHSRIQNWDDWSGNLKSFIWSHDDKMFTRMGRQWAKDFCGEPEKWDSFVKEVLQ